MNADLANQACHFLPSSSRTVGLARCVLEKYGTKLSRARNSPIPTRPISGRATKRLRASSDKSTRTSRAIWRRHKLSLARYPNSWLRQFAGTTRCHPTPTVRRKLPRQQARIHQRMARTKQALNQPRNDRKTPRQHRASTGARHSERGRRSNSYDSDRANLTIHPPRRFE